MICRIVTPSWTIKFRLNELRKFRIYIVVVLHPLSIYPIEFHFSSTPPQCSSDCGKPQTLKTATASFVFYQMVDVKWSHQVPLTVCGCALQAEPIEALETDGCTRITPSYYAIRSELTFSRRCRYGWGWCCGCHCRRHRHFPWGQHPWGWNFGYSCAGRIYG